MRAAHAPGSLAAHPRSRGENVNDYFVNYCVEGSSPLTRGKPMPRANCLVDLGLIPAHAGKTDKQPHPALSLSAHPRSRGENPWTARSTRWVHGSSPLTRGKPNSPSPVNDYFGLIPAHAGKTFVFCVTSWGLRAHPRSRGENQKIAFLVVAFVGSSPLTRGKQHHRVCNRMSAGLIPAHAGKTGPPARGPRPPAAHPRSRGENPIEAQGDLAPRGSSPLTRGKPRPVRCAVRQRGLIPAHAGKTKQRAITRAFP